MKVLWIPHTPQHYLGWDGCRQFRIFEHLKNEADLHVVTWIQRKSLQGARRWGSVTVERDWYGTRYDVLLAPNFHRALLRNSYPPEPALWLNQRLFQAAVRRIRSMAQPDCTVVSITHQWTGYPPFDVLHPLVFDHVDRAVPSVEDRYVRECDAIVAVSDALLSRHRGKVVPAAVISNGVNLDAYRGTDRLHAKERLGLLGHTVVSLIGLTCSADLYFVDAVRHIQQAVPNLALLVVGGGATLSAIQARARKVGLRNLIAPGHVPSNEVAPYFAASDVGLYPGDNTPWFLDAAPLKIIEYSACRVPVVSSPVRMFQSGWPNVLVVEPSAQGFAAGILQALSSPTHEPDLREFDWQRISSRFHSFLVAVRSRHEQSRQ